MQQIVLISCSQDMGAPIIYLNTKQLGLVPLLNISTTYLEIERWAGKSTAFLQSCKEYRFIFGSVEWQLLSAQVDTVLATSFNWVLTEVIEGHQGKDIGKVLIIKVGNIIIIMIVLIINGWWFGNLEHLEGARLQIMHQRFLRFSRLLLSFSKKSTWHYE